jgi:HSP20 family protein
MNSLTSWNPFRELEDMQNRILRAVQLNPLARVESEGRPLAAAQWTPAVDISEDASEYLIKAELPEIGKDDVKVTVENGVLTLRGERRFEKEETTRKYHRIERGYGSFMRSLSLPDDADADKVSAEYRDGVLSVHLPKSEAKKPKQIEVSVN